MAWVHGPGPYAEQLLTILCAPTIAALAQERARLTEYLGPAWKIEEPEMQTPVVAAALRGDLDEWPAMDSVALSA